MVERTRHANEGRTRIVSHRGDWTRVDMGAAGSAVSTEYYHRGCASFPRHTRDRENTFLNVAVSRNCHRSPGWDYRPVKTDERQSLLGESCTVWIAWRSDRFAGSTLTKSSCVTDDGIELWFKITSDYGLNTWAEATRVERRTVTRVEAEPPADMLALGHWFVETSDPPARNDADFEIVMEQEGNPAFTRTIRRRAGWHYEEERSGAALESVSLHHLARELSFSVFNLQSDRPGLVINDRFRARTRPATDAPPPGKRMDRPDEAVLGERCVWFDLTPDMSHGTHYACRAQDGIALREEWRGRDISRILTAVRLARRPIALDEIKPPPELLDRKTWGLPE
jgi:hypothetical protein